MFAQLWFLGWRSSPGAPCTVVLHTAPSEGRAGGNMPASPPSSPALFQLDVLQTGVGWWSVPAKLPPNLFPQAGRRPAPAVHMGVEASQGSHQILLGLRSLSENEAEGTWYHPVALLWWHQHFRGNNLTNSFQSLFYLLCNLGHCWALPPWSPFAWFPQPLESLHLFPFPLRLPQGFVFHWLLLTHPCPQVVDSVSSKPWLIPFFSDWSIHSLTHSFIFWHCTWSLK